MVDMLRAAIALGLIWGFAGAALADWGLASAGDNASERGYGWAAITNTEMDVTDDVYVATTQLPLVAIDGCEGTCDSLCGSEERDCCSGSDCWCPPRWTVSVGAIFLHRSRLDSGAIATPPTGTPGVLINSSDFGFGTDAGPDVSVTRRSDNGLIWEARYFNDHSAIADFEIPSVTSFRMAGIGITILGGGSINSRYLTQLDSSELNVHLPMCDRVTFLTGFRWVELHEDLRSDLATPVTFMNWDVNNHLYGGQIGTNILFTDPANPLRVNLALKGGVYYNAVDNEFTSTVVGGDFESDQVTALVGDLNFTAAYQLTDHIAIQGGYQILWLDNVGVAGDIAAGTTQVVGGTSSPVDADGRLWFHGATAGLVVSW